MDPGPLLFARFAYPPNVLGYCGPDGADELLERTATSADGPGLRRLARGFEGAWPYLELIAHENGIGDPLDARVVEAYWIGNRLLDRVRGSAFRGSLTDRFRPRVRRGAVGPLLDPVADGGVPHHAFHVFGVFPWVGLLRGGVVDEPMRVLDRCRIRWGRVEAVLGERALVRSRPLVWRDGRLRLGPAVTEDVAVASSGRSLAGGLAAGDLVACHWDWVCTAISPAQAAQLRRRTGQVLAAVQPVRAPVDLSG
jgi:hypothetical protein